MGAVATISAPHATSPLCNTSHCLTGRSSSPTTPSTSLQAHTTPTRASWLALALVHLLHQHTALDVVDQTSVVVIISAPHTTSPLTVQHLPQSVCPKEGGGAEVTMVNKIITCSTNTHTLSLSLSLSLSHTHTLSLSLTHTPESPRVLQQKPQAWQARHLHHRV